ncbi:MAG: hypothetical protein B1H04_03130 [Planctomycetales bacterium 4484_123]|nr:MAG: hypothetical protein B1H04_03130 [Planctomycetales bacterium 4484_123]
MPRMRLLSLLATASLLALAGGCGESAEDVSNSEYLLGLLHESWQNARKGLQSEQPDLGPLRAIHILLARRAPRRVQRDYHGPNKEEVLRRLHALRDAYEARIVPKLDLTQPEVRLQPGATVQEVKAAFMELDKAYRQIDALLQQ